MKSALVGGLAALALTGGLALADPAKPDKSTGSSDPAANAGPKASSTSPEPDTASASDEAEATSPGAGTDKSDEDQETGNNADRDSQGSKSAQ